MYSIRIIVIIIAVNVVKAERETHKHHSKMHEDSKHSESEESHDHGDQHQIPRTVNAHQKNDERLSTDTSLGPTDDYYDSTDYEEIDTEHTRRFADNQEETKADEEDRSASFGETAATSAIKDKPSRESNEDVYMDPVKRKTMQHHVILDTKGRSAARDISEENFKIAAADVRNLDNPRLGNPRPCYKGGNICSNAPYPLRNGYIQPHFPPAPRPGIFHGPLYSIHQPFIFPAAPELTPSIKGSSPAEEKENIPFTDTNSYPYQTPLTKMDEIPQEVDGKFDILKKLIDATNLALTTNKPNPYFDSNNMYPMNFNPGAGRFRRSLELNINSFRTM